MYINIYLHPFLDISFNVLILVCLSSHLHHQASRSQILWYLCAVVATSKHWRVVVHVCHIDDDCGDVTEGRLASTSLHREVVLPRNFKVQRCNEGQKACENHRARTELFSLKGVRWCSAGLSYICAKKQDQFCTRIRERFTPWTELQIFSTPLWFTLV